MPCTLKVVSFLGGRAPCGDNFGNPCLPVFPQSAAPVPVPVPVPVPIPLQPYSNGQECVVQQIPAAVPTAVTHTTKNAALHRRKPRPPRKQQSESLRWCCCPAVCDILVQGMVSELMCFCCWVALQRVTFFWVLFVASAGFCFFGLHLLCSSIFCFLLPPQNFFWVSLFFDFHICRCPRITPPKHTDKADILQRPLVVVPDDPTKASSRSSGTELCRVTATAS